jgi:hypothetical protein
VGEAPAPDVDGVVTEGTSPAGVDAEGVVTGRDVAEGVVTDGTVTAGVVTDGVVTCGVVTAGVVTTGVVIEGIESAGIVTAGTVNDGTVTVAAVPVSGSTLSTPSAAAALNARTFAPRIPPETLRVGKTCGSCPERRNTVRVSRPTPRRRPRR